MAELTRTPLTLRVTVVLSLLVAPVMIAAPAAGGPSDTDPTRPGFSLSVGPTRLVVPAGALRDRHYVQVTNQGREKVRIQVGKRNFAQRSDGSLVFLRDAPYAASTWVRAAPDHFSLRPGATKKVRVTISVPDRPEAGEHQVVLVFLALADDEAANIRINRGIGTPVYISVPGPLDDSVRVEGLRAPGFALGGPIRLGATVRSVGTMHRDFRGPDRLGVRVDDRLVRFPDFTVVRGAVRDVETVWRNPPLACVCHARLVVPGPGGEAREVPVRIVIVPLHLIGAVLAVALLILLVPRLVARRYRARVRAAVEAAQAGGDA
jgi:hypothetical protein